MYHLVEMAECAYCGYELPGTERICRDCYQARYAGLGAPEEHRWWKETPQPQAVPQDTSKSGSSLAKTGEQHTVTIEESLYPNPVFWGICLAGAGLVLYAVFTYVAPFFSGLIVFLALGIFWYNWTDRSKRKARFGTPLWWMLLGSAALTLALWKMTGNAVWERLSGVAGCLYAAHIWIDRRRSV
jgi:hypothetical protein